MKTMLINFLSVLFIMTMFTSCVNYDFLVRDKRTGDEMKFEDGVITLPPIKVTADK